MFHRIHFWPVWVTVALIFAIPAGLLAQTESVYVANSSNNRILRIDPIHFEDPAFEPEVVNTDAPLRKQLQGLLVRALDELIVCDTLGNTVLLYNTNPDTNGEVIGQVITDDIASPDGVSIDGSGNLFLVSSGPGQGKPPEVWKIPFDGSELVPIDKEVPAELLEDTKVAPFTIEGVLEAGDLLVLASVPAKLFRYHETGGVWERFELIPTDLVEFPPDAQPNGFVFDPNGNLLISIAGGTILWYNLAEQSFFEEPFASGLGDGKFKISVGIQTDPLTGQGVNRVFVANRNGGEVIRFRFDDRQPDGVVTNRIEFPVGVAAATSNAVPVFVGERQTALLSNLTATFETVASGGFYDASCLWFVDPREGDLDCSASSASEPLRCSLSLRHHALPPALKRLRLDVDVPPYVRAFEVEGQPAFRLCITSTTALLAGIVEFDAENSKILHECDLPSSRYLEGRMFYAPETWLPKEEYPMAEGPMFKDISVKCGSHLGWSRGRGSLILDTVRDVRPIQETPSPECETDIHSAGCDIISFKLFHLERALTSSDREEGGLAEFIVGLRVRRNLEKQIKDARRAFARGDVAKLVRVLDAFLSDVHQSTSGGFDESVTAVGAELKERAASTIFTACKLLDDPKPSACNLCILVNDPACQP